ncbi:hypothetical protein H6G54_07050 [Anabaena cylindrica FACHB-243]|uniref:Uncharacterized protein n=1 Tax=Anabaena cylindrica (strain ATCC 27899 / PCC 7122) TaxID=272123 RepID=K9ZAQ2_ANACC|nr:MULTISPECIES: hypothetical protein [Anabaena]AFZ56241.1 hypothetical protein Anacy_0649 [Anabaena cylindrica PCC 7122]MBD2417468.1 hypothetical protein [Anabaena cylindrica FACHB-243]MBY5285629.1 hypothetical protein [Anabaena sp. CCAP 1446/1C]MBY5310961.1 hypothetical protein [Anabaena sp. CCAP 1446/1C]MCM2407637.1 hypothetical protein [Anabaena sp. CCAP 1446/1C]
MSRLLYESSVSYQGYLIIPFVFGKIDNYEIFSYKLLSEIGRKSNFHKLENPAKIYDKSISNIVDIAKEHIDRNAEFINYEDGFKSRYVYRHNLIIVYTENNKIFYDHYPPNSLNNIAAPKLFSSEYECLQWVQQGLEGRDIKEKAQ